MTSTAQTEATEKAARPPRRLVLSPAGKALLIAVLVVALLVPLLFVKLLVDERDAYAMSVRGDIARGWGGSQTIAGPFLAVPYTAAETVVVDGRETRREVPAVLAILPQRFEANAEATTEVLKRSIYAVAGYRADVALSGAFAPVTIADLPADAVRVDWSRARVVLAISDPSGLRDGVALVPGGGEPLPFEPGVPDGNPGIHANPFRGLSADAGGLPALDFEIPLKLSGTELLNVAPVGRTSVVTMRSDWPHPSFTGDFLPAERRVEADGFTASWRVPDLARPVPQALAGVDTAVNSFHGAYVGVRFIDPVDFYALVDRAVKYGILFLAVAFGGVFAMELASRGRFHPMQYVFVGIAIVLFYVLLLALAEVIGFTPAYVLAAASLVAQLATYVGVALRSRGAGLAMAAILAVAFALLYGLLQLQAYALLVGAIAAFLLLTAAMFLTLRVDWSAIEPAAASPEPGPAAP